MRKLTVRDTLIIAAFVAPFAGYSVRGSVPFVQDARGMAGVGILGCLLAFAVFGRKAFGRAISGGPWPCSACSPSGAG
jgi:hypothetical protein